MKSKLLRLFLLCALLAGLLLALVYRDALSPAQLQAWVDQAGLLGPLLFMLFYALGTVLFLPGSVLTLAGGALFGPVLGVAYNLTGATAGAALAFLIARYFAASWVEQKTGGRLKQLKEGVEAEGWRFVALVRLVPIFPFNLLNYALGLSRIRFTHYLLASYLCMLPGAVAYTYLGYIGREAVGGSEDLIQKGLIALALLAVVAFLPRLIRRFRQADGAKLSIESAELKQCVDVGDEVLFIDVRSAAEFSQGHIAGAVNIPLPDLTRELGSLKKYPEKAIVLVCQTERRSRQAQKLLSQQGFAQVLVARGGMNAWQSEGFEVTSPN